jgi:hypothetical protein
MTFMAKLGDYMFSIDSAAFQSLDRQSSYRWQPLERIGRKPAHQFTGQGADTITLSGTILTTFRGGIGQVGQMRAQAGQGVPLPFVYAFENAGQYCGQFCILSINEKRTVFFDNGMPRKIEFDLQIVEYGADTDVAAAAGALSMSFSQAAGAAAGGMNTDLKATAGALASTAAKTAIGGTNPAAGLSLGGMVGTALSALGIQTSSTSLAAMSTDAGKLLNVAIPGLGNVGGIVDRIGSASSAVLAAKTPMEMSAALVNAIRVTRGATTSFDGISKQVRAAKNGYNGAGSGALHRQQAENIAGAFGDLAGSSSSIGAAAKAAQGVLGV